VRAAVLAKGQRRHPRPEEALHLSAPLLPREIKVSVELPSEINVNLKRTAGVLVDYDADGHVIGTRPRKGGA
jgi:hypothetical protein